MGEAFDQAWNQIAANYGDHAKRVEVARLKLADAVLRIASPDSVDVDALRIGALQKMAEDQPCNIGSPQQT
jgi:hypothetical protein